MSSRRPKSLKPFSRILKEIRRTEAWGRRISRHRAFLVWESAVGAAVARVARLVAVRGGCLRVEVSDSAWLQECELAKEQLLAKVNERLDRSDLNEIRFIIGNAAEAAPEDGADEASRPKPAGISPRDEKDVTASLRELADLELRLKAENLLARARQSGAKIR